MIDVSAVDLGGFLAVAESGHLTGTAAELGVSQPTLTRRIRRVEKTVGAELFDRVGRRMSLNVRGRAYLPHARAVLAEHPGVEFLLHQGAARVLVERVLADTADIALVGPAGPGDGGRRLSPTGDRRRR